MMKSTFDMYKRERKKPLKSSSKLKRKVESNETKKNKKAAKKLKKSKIDEISKVTGANSLPNLNIAECGFKWNNLSNNDVDAEASSNSDEEDKDSVIKVKKHKLSSIEKRELERQKERLIRENEEALAGSQLPQTVDQFDRLVLSNPDSSLIWIQYMSYHLQATEIDKARAVARRALKMISFREENEKLNIWHAWLNLESKFGSPELLNEVFQEAIKTNDTWKIYELMLNIYIDNGRQSELEKIINAMIKKFKQNVDTWVCCGAAFLKIGMKNNSRHTMQRALQSLPTNKHVDLIVKFAQLENKYGDKERGQTLYEQILSSYVKRVDIWSSYVDSLVKSGEIEIARKVLDRAIIQALPARKMKVLFKKYISFEENHGSPENVFRIQQLAVKYVEDQCKKVKEC